MFTLAVFSDVWNKVGYLRTLEENDLFEVASDCRAISEGERLEIALNKVHQWCSNDGKSGVRPFLWAVYRVYWRQFWLSVCLQFIYGFSGIGISLLTRRLLDFVASGFYGFTREPVSIGCGCAIGLFLLVILQSLSLNQEIYITEILRRRVRTGFNSLILSRYFKLNASTRGRFPSGKIVNLASIDTRKLDLACRNMAIVITFPVVFGCGIGVLVNNIGVSGLVGIGVIVGGIVLFLLCATINAKLREQVIKNTDRRVSVVKQALEAIRLIKFYGWEAPYGNRIFAARKKEQLFVSLTGASLALIIALSESMVYFAGLAAFSYYSKTGNVSFRFKNVLLINVISGLVSLYSTTSNGFGNSSRCCGVTTSTGRIPEHRVPRELC